MLDSVFEQKNEIVKAVEEELEKVFLCLLIWFSIVKLPGKFVSL